MPRDIIFVTNNNEFHHEDAFDGEHFSFPPKEKVQVPVEAAAHMFGFGLEDKTDTLVRLGWASRYDEKLKRTVEDPNGARKLSKFVFTQAVMVEAPVNSAADVKKPAPMAIA